MPDVEELLTKEDKVKIKRCLYALQRNGLPPITTHNVVDDWNDPVLSAVRRCYLFNTVHDRVKVIKVLEMEPLNNIDLCNFCLFVKFLIYTLYKFLCKVNSVLIVLK